jgi:hypothetical protein
VAGFDVGGIITREKAFVYVIVMILSGGGAFAVYIKGVR